MLGLWRGVFYFIFSKSSWSSGSSLRQPHVSSGYGVVKNKRNPSFECWFQTVIPSSCVYKVSIAGSHHRANAGCFIWKTIKSTREAKSPVFFMWGIKRRRSWSAYSSYTWSLGAVGSMMTEHSVGTLERNIWNCLVHRDPPSGKPVFFGFFFQVLCGKNSLLCRPKAGSNCLGFSARRFFSNSGCLTICTTKLKLVALD